MPDPTGVDVKVMVRLRAYDWSDTPEDTGRCVVSVSESGRGVGSHQCRRVRGRGPGGLFCGPHAKAMASGRSLHVPPEGSYAQRKLKRWKEEIADLEKGAMRLEYLKRIVNEVEAPDVN